MPDRAAKFGPPGGTSHCAVLDIKTKGNPGGTGDLMKKESVPQDDNKTYRGYGTKVMYALDESGSYTQVKSSGWDAEEIVLRDVVDDFAQKAAEAKARVMADQASPIEYFMHLKLMDLTGLAYGLGMAKWRVKRHMNPRVFKRLPQKTLQRYADYFNIDLLMLTRFKENI